MSHVGPAYSKAATEYWDKVVQKLDKEDEILAREWETLPDGSPGQRRIEARMNVNQREREWIPTWYTQQKGFQRVIYGSTRSTLARDVDPFSRSAAPAFMTSNGLGLGIRSFYSELIEMERQHVRHYDGYIKKIKDDIEKIEGRLAIAKTLKNRNEDVYEEQLVRANQALQLLQKQKNSAELAVTEATKILFEAEKRDMLHGKTPFIQSMAHAGRTIAEIQSDIQEVEDEWGRMLAGEEGTVADEARLLELQEELRQAKLQASNLGKHYFFNKGSF
jgi:hypothetical protein